MAVLIVKEIPEDLRAEFKALCAKQRTTIKDAIIRLMNKAVKDQKL